MGKRKTSNKKQPTSTEHALPLLKKPMEQLGKQIDVPGNHWQGRMSDEEHKTKQVPSARWATSRRSSSHIPHEANVEQYFSRAVSATTI